jgi:hypothetical protein
VAGYFRNIFKGGFMPEEGQVTPIPGNQDGTVTPDPQSLGWRAALPNEFKEHEYVKTFTKPGDFVKSALEIKTERDALNTKLASAIFKPSDKATPEEITAFHKALGVPDKAEEYEFPKGDGVEHDQKMIDWARGVFHEAKISKEAASVISKKWDAFMQQMAVAEKEAVEKELSDAEGKLKEEWKADYDKNIELSKRAFKHFSNAELSEFKAHPVLIKAFHTIGVAMGEDFSPKGLQPKAPVQSGFVYDKSPKPT